jgi:hypothetical protein
MWRWLVVVALAACAEDDVCPETLAAHCASQGGCGAPMTWAEASTQAGWGYTAPPCANPLLFPSLGLTDCANGTHRAGLWGTDSGRDYYYSASGDLYRIEDSSANNGGSHMCVAGTAPLPACDNATFRTLDFCPPP